MFSRAIGRRCYSTPKAISKLWVKHNGSPSTQVSTKSCINIDDFADKVKQKLNTNSQVALFTSLENNPLRPGLKITELLKTELKNNTDEIPLFVKIIPATQDSVATKTIYIRDTDDDGELIDEYIKYNVKNKEDLRFIYKNGNGLIQLSDPATAIVNFDEIEQGKKYQVYKI